MEIASRLIVIAFGIWMIGVSGVIYTRPDYALASLRKFASTNLINYTELGFRLLVGLGFIGLASHTNYVQVIKYVGIFFVISALILILIPRAWHHKYAVWWADKLTHRQVRFCAPFSFVTGVFVIILAVS